MTPQRVLYVGGTGTISWSCVMRSVAAGTDVSVLNRGMSAGRRPLPGQVHALRADIRDRASVEHALGAGEFDAVVNFLSFTAPQAAEAAEIFTSRTGHYVHISTAALYQKPPRHLPYLESTVRHNPASQYARDKIAAEDLLLERYGRDGFPVTIVRPSHTYDDAKPPVPGDWTVIDRIVRGRQIVVPGDGTSLWTLTHADDFAVGLVGLLGNPAAVGEAFHITSDFVYSWNQIYEILAAAAGTQAHLAHVPTEFLPFAAPDWRWSELIQGDLQYSVILDNSKIRAYVPEFAPRISLHQAARDIVTWRLEHAEQARPDPEVDAVIDRLLSGYHESARLFAALAPRQPAMS
jgi:nucleoside-diphosphate-sugar epimerase